MATLRQKKVVEILSENIGKKQPFTWGEVLLGAGYSIQTSKTPKRVTETKGFQELLEETLPDDLLAETHKDLLKTTRVEHMVFPLFTGEADDDEGKATKGATLSDEDIREMLAEVNCKVQRIVHGETARHVYYWVADAGARLSALKLAYQVKGELNKQDRVPEKTGGDTYNMYLQQNNINPNAPSARELVKSTVDHLMKQTSRKRHAEEGEVIDKQ